MNGKLVLHGVGGNVGGFCAKQSQQDVIYSDIDFDLFGSKQMLEYCLVSVEACAHYGWVYGERGFGDKE
jgi:hypothetical protein